MLQLPVPSTLLPYTTLFRSLPTTNLLRGWKNTMTTSYNTLATLAIKQSWREARAFTVLFFALLRSEEHTSELQSRGQLVCRLLLEKKKRQGSNRTSKGRIFS